VVERRDVVQAALRWAEEKSDQAGFVDVLIARHAGMAALG